MNSLSWRLLMKELTPYQRRLLSSLAALLLSLYEAQNDLESLYLAHPIAHLDKYHCHICIYQTPVWISRQESRLGDNHQGH
mmetsp:Transcript_155993/g.275676  ORF Transcript_155993/g.275676 Transcript_155993/m.275676 type:complete len:81 (-) Transcript_155993:9-251(-)